MNGGGADTNVNGQRAWDAFWKVLSILVLPWCTFMSWAAWQTAADVRVVKVKQEDFERRLDIIEVQMDPSKRFYRWDGTALQSRIEELEHLHPRQLERRQP